LAPTWGTFSRQTTSPYNHQNIINKHNSQNLSIVHHYLEKHLLATLRIRRQKKTPLETIK
jgi:hypothetical protein